MPSQTSRVLVIVYHFCTTSNAPKLEIIANQQTNSNAN